jgi:hypothetical protein
MEYINKIMKSINDLTDEIYEGLADQDHDEVNRKIGALIALLKDLQQSIKEEL